MKQPMKKGSFVPKNVPGVGWGGSCRGGMDHAGVGWGGSCRGWGAIHIQHFMSDSNSKNNNSQGFKNS